MQLASARTNRSTAGILLLFSGGPQKAGAVRPEAMNTLWGRFDIKISL